MITVHDILNQHIDTNDIDIFDAQLIVAHVLQTTREFIVAHPDTSLTKDQEKIINQLIQRRKSHEPIAYLLGEKYFFGKPFLVSRDTLIPRPETELLVEKALRVFYATHESEKKILVADIGTGSGCILISMAHDIANNIQDTSLIQFLGIDISPKALDIARKNAKHYQLENRITFSCSDMIDNFSDTLHQSFDTVFITANLPYISTDDYQSTPDDVRLFEPKTALESGADGLNHYRKLLSQIKQQHLLYPNIQWFVFLEIDPKQKEVLKYLIKNNFPQSRTEVSKDYSKHWRIVFTEIPRRTNT